MRLAFFFENKKVFRCQETWSSHKTSETVLLLFLTPLVNTQLSLPPSPPFTRILFYDVTKMVSDSLNFWDKVFDYSTLFAVISLFLLRCLSRYTLRMSIIQSGLEGKLKGRH